MQTVKEWAEDFAKYTWERLKFVYHTKQAKLNETTITDDLVFQINSKFRDHRHIVLLEHAENENRNGNDLEIVIANNGLYKIFPVQAKRIYANQKYPRFNHKGQEQLENFLAYAKEIEGVPFYLLYNYHPENFHHPKESCGRKILVEQYGCTLVSAVYIKHKYAYARVIKDKRSWKIPNFSSLHYPAYALPWHLLFYDSDCFLKQSENRDLFADHPIRQYTKKELFEDDRWRPVFQLAEQKSTAIPPIQGQPMQEGFTASSLKLKENSTLFSPRYRLLIEQ